VVDIERLKSEFSSRYGQMPRLFSAPGRVNLIGEHTDYNDGFVLPMAIDRRTFVAGRARSDRKFVARFVNLDESAEFDLDQPGPPRRNNWRDYVEGTAQMLPAQGFTVGGADILLESNVPPGAGLSASAAMEVSVGLALTLLSGASEPDRVKLALAGQAAEHAYAGTNSGIMDQYIAALGRKNHALLIDCRTLEPTLIPLELGAVSVLVCDTRVKHELASSEYNTRRAECEEAVRVLATKLPGIKALRDVDIGSVRKYLELLSPAVRKRTRHVVSENARTLVAADALRDGDLVFFGKLMIESHASLRDDFEVSCAELDLAVDVALSEPGVFGARMTGGGFGGCTVSLVENDALERVKAKIESEFQASFGLKPELFATPACDGAREH